jgi:hypothetical protein
MQSSCCQLTQLCSLNKDFIIIIIWILSHESRSQKIWHPPQKFLECAPLDIFTHDYRIEDTNVSEDTP